MDKEPLIELQNVNYTYMPDTPFACQALKDVSLRIFPEETVGIVGATGSGKSTLSQHFNGLLQADGGSVRVMGAELGPSASGKDLAKVRFSVGMLFQFPEQQLFAETLFEDVAFGPRNMDVSEPETEERVIEALKSVGLDYLDAKKVSPLLLSGGEKRRAALAGVLAMRPKCLVLDEPTAGLDPRGTEEILTLLKAMQAERRLTLIMVSHRFDELAKLCRRLIVMDHGRIAADGDINEILYSEEILAQAGLSAPDICCIFNELHKNGLCQDKFPIEPKEAADILQPYLNRAD